MEIIKTAAAILYKGDEVLLVEYLKGAQHNAGVIGFTGRRLNPDESFLDAAVRELEEESGLNVNPSDLIEIPRTYEADITRKDGTTRRYIMKAYVGTKWSGELNDSEETRPIWLPIERLAERECMPNVEKVVTDGLKYIQSIE